MKQKNGRIRKNGYAGRIYYYLVPAKDVEIAVRQYASRHLKNRYDDWKCDLSTVLPNAEIPEIIVTYTEP